MRKLWRYLHWLIIINFLAEIFYGFYMVFFAVGGSRFPLWMRAVDIPMEVILKRRLYAIEVWIAIAGLVIYVALTEVIPRKLTELQDSIDEKSE